MLMQSREHVDCAGCGRPVPLDPQALWGVCKVCWLVTGTDSRVYGVACTCAPWEYGRLGVLPHQDELGRPHLHAVLLPVAP